MNKQKHNVKLGVNAAHTRAMLKSLTIALIEKESIVTTKPRTRAVRSFVERLITIAKRGDLASSRLIFDRLRDKSATDKLMNKIAKRLDDRNSGYVSIYKTMSAAGNNAEMFRISFIDYTVKEKKSKRTKKAKEEEVKTDKKESKGIMDRIRPNRNVDKKSQVASSASKAKANSRSGL